MASAFTQHRWNTADALFFLSYFFFLFHFPTEMCTCFSSVETSAIDLKLWHTVCRIVSVRVPTFFFRKFDTASRNLSPSKVQHATPVWDRCGPSHCMCGDQGCVVGVGVSRSPGFGPGLELMFIAKLIELWYTWNKC